MVNSYPLKVYDKPELQNAPLIVTWNEDAGGLGSIVADYITNKLYAEKFAQLDPADFFPLGGVAIEDDVADFPACKFYDCQENVALFSGTPPRFEWYRYFNTVLDVARDYCHTSELYALGGMVTLQPHSAPRQLFAIANCPDMKAILEKYGIASEADFETQPGQRPTLNSYLLWCARRRNIMAATLWVPVPFYLVSSKDPEAAERLLKFLDQRTGAGLDFSELERSIAELNSKIIALRHRSATVNESLSRLENNIALTEEESEKLVREIEEHLRSGGE